MVDSSLQSGFGSLVWIDHCLASTQGRRSMANPLSFTILNRGGLALVSFSEQPWCVSAHRFILLWVDVGYSTLLDGGIRKCDLHWFSNRISPLDTSPISWYTDRAPP